MFDIGWTEMLVIAVLAIVVIGPKDLPRVMRGLARIVAKMRGLAREFQDGMNELARETEIDDLKTKVADMTRIDVEGAVRKVIDPQHQLDLDATVSPAQLPDPAESTEAADPAASSDAESQADGPPVSVVPQPDLVPSPDHEEAADPPADEPTPSTPATEKPPSVEDGAP